ncbi:trypsin-1-like [Ornithodoros turicata]|uniref:trypsin-1-like n=1 Tax=Ornithodoros turicata TaxID=34597 RepID=UPI00313891E5
MHAPLMNAAYAVIILGVVDAALAFDFNADKCGVSSVPALNILGGKETHPGQFPWQVLLEWRGQHFCGGSIISPSKIVTAAHCVVNFTLGDLYAVAGLRKRDYTKSGEAHVQKRKVAAGERHESFYGKYGHQKYDIGLLTLEEPFDLQSADGHIAPVCLPPENFTASGTVTVTGFGRDLEGETPLSDTLQVITIPVLPDEDCHKAYGGRFFNDSMFCAGGESDSKDACKGDSGGPAVQKVNGRYILAGIVSWGEGCGKAEKPGVYTQVSRYLDWIGRRMSPYSEQPFRPYSSRR